MLHRRVDYTIRMGFEVCRPRRGNELGSGSCCMNSALAAGSGVRAIADWPRASFGLSVRLKPDVKAVDGPTGAETDFTIACMVRGLPSRRGLDRSGSDIGPVGRGRAHSGGVHPEPSSAHTFLVHTIPVKSDLCRRWRRCGCMNPPRVKPYAEQQWREIESRWAMRWMQICLRDVRLTMGGEPTFVPHWIATAKSGTRRRLAPPKRGLAAELMHKLSARYAPGGFLHFGTEPMVSGRETSCRAGRSPLTGARTACCAGATRLCSPMSAMHNYGVDECCLHPRAGRKAGKNIARRHLTGL